MFNMLRGWKGMDFVAPSSGNDSYKTELIVCFVVVFLDRLLSSKTPVAAGESMFMYRINLFLC